MEPDEINQRDEFLKRWEIQSILNDLKAETTILRRQVDALGSANNIHANNVILMKAQIKGLQDENVIAIMRHELSALRLENDSIRRVMDEILRLTERIANGEPEGGEDGETIKFKNDEDCIDEDCIDEDYMRGKY